MTDPWSEIAALLATVIEKYGTQVLASNEQTQSEEPEEVRTFAKEEKN